MMKSKACPFCGGKPTYTKERYVELYRFNHTCKKRSPQIHIKSEGYNSLEDAKKAWNERMEGLE